MGDSTAATVGVGSTVRVTRMVDDVIEAGAVGVVLLVYGNGNLRVSFGTRIHPGEYSYLRWTVPADAYEVLDVDEPVYVNEPYTG